MSCLYEETTPVTAGWGITTPVTAGIEDTTLSTNVNTDKLWDVGHCTKVTTVCLVSTLVISSNIFNIICWLRVKRIAVATKLLLVNLSLSDLCVGLVACTPSVYAAVLARWPYGDIWCQISGISHGTSVTVSIWSISLVGIDRYIAVTWPLKYHTIVNKYRCGCIVGGMWLSAVATFLAPCFTKSDFIYYQYEDKYGMCGMYWEYRSFCAITGLYIPILCGGVLLYTSISIVRALNMSNKFRESTSFVQSPLTASMNRKALRVVMATSIVYFAFWGPYVTLVVVEALLPRLQKVSPDWLSFGTMWLANSNSGVNICVYLVTSASFRRHLMCLLRCQRYGTHSL